MLAHIDIWAWMMDMRLTLKYSTAKLSPAIMRLWNFTQPETIRAKPC